MRPISVAVAVVVAGLAVAIGGSASADPIGISVGVHGGLNLARISSDTAVDTEFVPAAVVGADVLVDFYAPFSLSAGIEYLGAGGKVTATTPGSPTIDYSMAYLAFPVNVRYGLGAGPAEAFVFAGATFGALLSADQKRESAGGDVDTDVKSALAGFLVTVDLGGGIGYRLSDRITAGADVRYSLGVTDVAKSDPALAVKSWHTNGLQVLVGISYRFGAVTPGPDRTNNYARN